MAELIRNPNLQTSGESPQNANGVAELDTSEAGNEDGTIQKGAQWIGVINNGDGAGGGSDALFGRFGKMIPLPAGVSKTYPLTRSGSEYPQMQFVSNGNQLLITVIY